MSGDHDLDRLTSLMFSFSRILRRESICALGAGGMSLLQMGSLLLISEQEGLTVKDLARQLRITPPSATSLMNRLEHLGLAKRRRGAENRKIVHIHLTSEGRSLLEERMGKKHTSLRRILSVLSPDDRNALIRILEHLVSVHSANSHAA